MLIAALPAICRAAWYTPASTVLDADTGKNAWEGPNDCENLGAQTGAHSADSAFSYFSGWSIGDVNCAAASSAYLSDTTIALAASDSSDGYEYDYTQAAASATVSFALASSQWVILNNSSTYADADQVSCVLTGPDGWTWSGTYGAPLLAPAGVYDFSISADVERTAGIDSPSSENASLQIVPEPGAMGVVVCSVFALNRKRKARL